MPGLRMLAATLLAFAFAGTSLAIDCKCDSSLSYMLDSMIRLKFPRLPKTVCIEGLCNIASQIESAEYPTLKPLCSYFASANLSGYYCGAGLNTDPATIKQDGITFTVTSCDKANCDAKAVSTDKLAERPNGPTIMPLAYKDGGATAKTAAILPLLFAAMHV